jgi:hypothetical protein
MSLTPFVVHIFLSDEKRRQGQQNNDEDFLQPHSQRSVLYHESEKWRNLFFDSFTIFVRKGVGLPISIIFFLVAKSLQENDCFNKSSITQSHTSSSMMQNYRAQHSTRIQQRLHD